MIDLADKDRQLLVVGGQLLFALLRGVLPHPFGIPGIRPHVDFRPQRLEGRVGLGKRA